ncbi:MAG: glycosyltransferase family 2 protein [Candidatus Blackburnbacteria bacterium]|nr:glycosyltransferase family 2 protein [Candidatus Blackburnbacteria bacterium]
MNIFADYYQKDLERFFKQIVPRGYSSTRIGEEKANGKSDYLLLQNSLAYSEDVQNSVGKLKKYCKPRSRIVVVGYSFLWKPILDLATFFGLRKKDPREPNWLSQQDINNIFQLEGCEEVKRGRRLLLPIPLGSFSPLINNFIGQLPLINKLCLVTYQIFRLKPQPKHYSVSIIIPARNEAGNIKKLLKEIPNLGKKTEVIFIEGHSTDNTYAVIQKEIMNAKKFKTLLCKQKNKGKADAVRLGFQKAKNDILIILDADLTVPPSDLIKFYRALSENHCDFANGSRLIYPVPKQAMRSLNYLGNKLFSLTFTFLLGQKIKDTLCGTKVLFRKDYLEIEKNRKTFGELDPFGDFDLLFGATKLNLKIIEVPVRYRERKYGKSNINRIIHGWLLLKMVAVAAKKIKFI